MIWPHAYVSCGIQNIKYVWYDPKLILWHPEHSVYRIWPQTYLVASRVLSMYNMTPRLSCGIQSIKYEYVWLIWPQSYLVAFWALSTCMYAMTRSFPPPFDRSICRYCDVHSVQFEPRSCSVVNSVYTMTSCAAMLGAFSLGTVISWPAVVMPFCGQFFNEIRSNQILLI